MNEITLCWTDTRRNKPKSGQRAPGGAVQFRVCALGAPQATVQSCTNLTDWQPLQVVPLVAGNGLFTDPDAPNYPRRFYRLRVP